MAARGGEVPHADLPRLADAVHPPDALRQRRRRPRQVEMDDEPAPRLQVQSFRGRIRRNEDACIATRESPDGVATANAVEATVDDGD